MKLFSVATFALREGLTGQENHIYCLWVKRLIIIYHFEADKWAISAFYHHKDRTTSVFHFGISIKHRYIAFVCPAGMACLNRHGLTVDKFKNTIDK